MRASATRRRLVGLGPALLAACGAGAPPALPPPPPALAHVVRTTNFVVHTDLDATERDFHARLLEGFRATFVARYHEVPSTAPLVVYLFGREDDFVAFRASLGLTADAYGAFVVFASGAPMLMANAATGLGTTLHELVHAFVHATYTTPPALWFNEGLASYHEKVLGSLDGTKLDASFGYFSNWRFQDVKAGVEQLSLDRLRDFHSDQTGAAQTLMQFLDRRGLFVPLVRAMRDAVGDPTGMQTLQKVWGRDLASLEAEWKAWVRNQPIDDDVLLVPKTTILPPDQWAAFLADHATELAWNEDLRRFAPPASRR